jgi:CheY-like chemotaxis protein
MSDGTPQDPIEILLVDDNPGDVRLVQEAIKGFKVSNVLRVARDGTDALEYLRGEGEYGERILPQLILLDLDMPKKQDTRYWLRSNRTRHCVASPSSFCPLPAMKGICARLTICTPIVISLNRWNSTDSSKPYTQSKASGFQPYNFRNSEKETWCKTDERRND